MPRGTGAGNPLADLLFALALAAALASLISSRFGMMAGRRRSGWAVGLDAGRRAQIVPEESVSAGRTVVGRRAERRACRVIARKSQA